MCLNGAVIAVGFYPPDIFQKLLFGENHIWIRKEFEKRFKFLFGQFDPFFSAADRVAGGIYGDGIMIRWLALMFARCNSVLMRQSSFS